MNSKDLLKILKKNIKTLIFFPMLLGVLVFMLLKNKPEEYTSTAVIYTGLASGYQITTEAHPRLDFNAVNNAFDNLFATLKARETLEEVGIRLLASHLMLDKPDKKIISENNFAHLKTALPKSLRLVLTDKTSLENTVENIYEYKNAFGKNPIKEILSSASEIYSPDFINKNMSSNRKATSDMLEVTYNANDPAVCYHTLSIISQVFINRYKDIKEGEINGVVLYFEGQVRNTQGKLKAAEERLRQFNVENQIINYQEQTKSLSQSKQLLIADIDKVRMALSSAEATVNNLEDKLDIHSGMLENNSKIVSKRQALSNLNYKIANATVYKISPEELTRFRRQADELKDEIKVLVTDLYVGTNTEEGFRRETILNQWLVNVLAIDENNAKLKIMEGRMQDYDEGYDKLGPLGGTLNSMEREVEVAEKEYLDLLNALTLNKQRQQNIVLSSNLKIVDNPFYPEKPLSSKKFLLVIASFIAGFILLYAILALLSFMDNSIKTPQRAETFTRLKLAGVLPYVPARNRVIDYRYLESSLMEQALSTIMLEINERNKSKSGTKVIMVSSPKSKEGKTWTAVKLANKLSEISGRVLFLYPQCIQDRVVELLKEKSIDSNASPEAMAYQVGRNFIKVTEVSQLFPEMQTDLDQYDYVVLEIPPLVENQLPVELVKKADLSLLVLSADRTWSENDSYISRLYRKASEHEPMLLLNRVSLDHIEDIFGELPKIKNRALLPPAKINSEKEGAKQIFQL